MIKNFLMLFLALSTLACNKESYDIVIDSELKPYFDLFALEAKKRGIEFDPIKANITTEIRNISGSNVIAQCTHYDSRPDVITVDIAYWREASDTDKEFYLFHELGHCFLNRGHLDTKDDEGNCVSIMHSSKNVCKFIYTKITRDTYLDELFKK